jgi:cell division protein FtsB
MDNLATAFTSYMPYALEGLLALLGCWVVYSLKRTFVRHEDMEPYAKRLHHLETHMSRLENKLDGLPTAQAINKLSLSIEAMRGDFKALEQKVESQAAAMDRLAKSVDMLTEAHMRTE